MKNERRNGIGFPLLLMGVALVLPLGGTLPAAVILADYEFTRNTAGAPATPPSNVALSAASAGNATVSIDSSSANASYSLTDTDGTTATSTDSTAATAFSNNYYVEFTLTPANGFAVSLDSLTFTIGGSSGAGNTFDANFYVRSNLAGTNFDTDVGSLQAYAVPAGAVTGNTPQAVTISLSSLAAFQDVSSAVTFRIYAYGDDYSTFSTGSRPRLDSVALNGDIVAVPEPRGIVLIFLGPIACLLFRQTRQAFLI